MKNDNDVTSIFLLILFAAGAWLLPSNFVIADGSCKPHWHQTIGQPGMSLLVLTSMVYNNELVAAGNFAQAGGQEVIGIAKWNGVEWQPLIADGQNGVGYTIALAEYEGDLIAGGWFATAGGVEFNYIARWDGAEWHQMGSGGQIGVSGAGVHALTIYDGDLIAGGSFLTAGGQTVNGIARWNGKSWQPFVSDGHIGVGGNILVHSLSVYNGDLIAGGRFTTAGGVTVNGLARWDGSAWHAFTSGGQAGVGGEFPWVWVVGEYNGDLLAGGAFTTAGGSTVNHLARWDGSTWQAFSSGGQIGLSNSVGNFIEFEGDLVVGGWFTSAGGHVVNRIARWDETAWQPFAQTEPVGLNNAVRTLTLFNSDLVVGGDFTSAGDVEANRIAKWRSCTNDPNPPGDLNGDGVVDVSDLLILLATWGPCPRSGDCPADINGDGTVDVSDLLVLLANWG